MILAVTGGSEAVVEMTALREPKRDDLGRSYATEREKTPSHVLDQAWFCKVVVNGKELGAYFARPVLQMIPRQPFEVAGVEDQFDVQATVKGGGLSGQAQL